MYFNRFYFISDERKDFMEFHCENLWLNILIFIAGSWVLIKGSGVFIDSAASLARLWHVSELVIGLTLVSIGTSLPEFATSLYAAFHDQSDFIIGNIVGSITTNITLVLGAGVVGAGKLVFSRKLYSRDTVLMLGIFLLTCLMFWLIRVPGKDGGSVPGINFWGGMLLLILGGAYMGLLVRTEKETAAEAARREKEAEGICKKPFTCFLWLIFSLAMVTGGSKAMVDTVIWGAEQLRIDPMVISATIVAFGTSVPELAVTLAGVLKKRHDIAIGNIVGSCSFNIFLVFGVCALVCPLGINSLTGIINVFAVLFIGLLLYGFMSIRKNELKRWQGVVFIFVYLVFLGYNFREMLSRIFS